MTPAQRRVAEVLALGPGGWTLEELKAELDRRGHPYTTARKVLRNMLDAGFARQEWGGPGSDAAIVRYCLTDAGQAARGG